MNKEDAINILKEGLPLTQDFFIEFGNDRDVMLEAVKQTSYRINSISKRLKNDKEIALEAVNKEGITLMHVSERLKKDKDVILVAVSNCGEALEYANRLLKDDLEVVYAAVSNSEQSIVFASQRIQSLIGFENPKKVIHSIFMGLKVMGRRKASKYK